MWNILIVTKEMYSFVVNSMRIKEGFAFNIYEPIFKIPIWDNVAAVLFSSSSDFKCVTKQKKLPNETYRGNNLNGNTC
jgi:hypothetical protein